MAVALVATGEGDKASRWMLEAAEGITKEEFLHFIVQKSAGGSDIAEHQADPVMRFHLICVQMLEQAGLSSAALRVALVALKSSKPDDHLLPTMWSVVAKLHLNLGHYLVSKQALLSCIYFPLNSCCCVNFFLINRKRMKRLLVIQTAASDQKVLDV